LGLLGAGGAEAAGPSGSVYPWSATVTDFEHLASYNAKEQEAARNLQEGLTLAPEVKRHG
jgi:hypothetical protein